MAERSDWQDADLNVVVNHDSNRSVAHVTVRRECRR
jgi:hypothetical protein